MTAFLANVQAWIYPGSPACNANVEYADGRVINTLKVEYLRMNSSGGFDQLNDPADGCNAYNAANAISVRSYCTRAFITVSGNGSPTDMDTICSSSANRSAAKIQFKNLLDLTGFQGIELDWEQYGSWTASQYTNYKTFVTELGDYLHTYGYLLMLDGPPIIAAVDPAYGQNLYDFTYEDFNSLPVDFLCMMAYDYQYDYGAGESISPNAFVDDCCDWILAKVTDPNKIVVGTPAYGYSGWSGGYNINIGTKNQMAALPGYAGATRNSDHEMNWTSAAGTITVTGALSSGATSATLSVNWPYLSGRYKVTFSNGNVRYPVFVSGAKTMTWTGAGGGALTSSATSSVTRAAIFNLYQDSTGMNSKRDLIEAKGIRNVSTWHLGGNDWYTIKTEPTTPSAVSYAITGVASITGLKSIVFS